ncbi:hypothetical protein Aduo_015106 [Ancylostoma duodenale]
MGKYSKIFTFSDEFVVCKHCKWTAKKPGYFSTSLLRHHLKTKHEDVLETFDADKKEVKEVKAIALKRTLTSEQEQGTVEPVKKPKVSEIVSIEKAFTIWTSDGVMTLKAERALMQLVCTSALPLSIVKSKGLRNFVNVLNTLYDEYKSKVKAMLDEATSLSFTCDAWSSADNRHALIALTAHYVDAGMHPPFAIVGASPIKGSHNAENIKSLLAKVLTTFDITENKIHLLVRDAASSMKKTATLLNIQSIDCFAHKLQLSVKDGLKLLGQMDSSDENIIFYQQFCEIPERTLVKGVEVRWNSMYDMLVRFLENRKALELFLIDHPKYPTIDELDWALMKKMVDILKPLALATKFVQHREYAPIFVVIPLYKVIMRELSVNSSPMKKVTDAIANGLRRRMHEEGYEDQEHFVLATMVDPRFKDTYIAPDKRDILLQKLEQLAGVQSRGHESPEVEDNDEDESNTFLRFWCDSPTSSVSPNPISIDAKAKAFSEMEDYLSRKPSFSIDPFEFWRNDINLL